MVSVYVTTTKRHYHTVFREVVLAMGYALAMGSVSMENVSVALDIADWTAS